MSSDKASEKETAKEMDASKLAGLYDEIAYRGFDPVEIVQETLEKWSDPAVFGYNLQRVCLAWIVGGPNPSRIAENAAKNKVRNPDKAAKYSASMLKVSMKLTPIVKSFPAALLFVRKQLASQGRIPKDDIFLDSAFIGLHPDGIRASLELGKSIAETLGKPFDESASRRRAERFGTLALKAQGQMLGGLWQNVAGDVYKSDLANMRGIYKSWVSSVTDSAQKSEKAEKPTSPK